MPDLRALPRLWTGDDTTPNAYRLFRLTFTCPGAVADVPPTAATLTLYAETSFHVWLNGVSLGRGPTLHHANRRPSATLDVGEILRTGRNVLALQVHAAGVGQQNATATASPGPVMRLDWRDAAGEWHAVTTADAGWRVTEQTGWLGDSPRRSWAIGFTEKYDARLAPDGWQAPGFNDRDWAMPEPRPATNPERRVTYEGVDLPALHTAWRPVTTRLGLWHVATPGNDPTAWPPLVAGQGNADFGKALMAEPWTPLAMSPGAANEDEAGYGGPQLSELTGRDGGFTLSGLDGGCIALAFDLGSQFTGHVGFRLDVEPPAADAADAANADAVGVGVIDFGWAELIEHGRPSVMRKGNTYADRIHLCAGRVNWTPHGFSAGRYLLLVVRGCRGSLRVHRLGMTSTEPDLSWRGRFRCSDYRLNDIWDLCARTVRVGTQEAIMDCPTREQAAYIGDGHPNGQWLGRLTGDWRHWRHLLRECLLDAAPDGQIKSSIFAAGFQLLLDYSLLAITGTHDYLAETGDLDTVREVLPAADRVVAWYTARLDAEGFLDLPWEQLKERLTGPHDKGRNYNLFIDHPGLGWHNQNEPGIDRRGCNAAFHALYIRALRSLADLHDAVGADDISDVRSAADCDDAATLRARADRLARAAAGRFWSDDAGAYVDGVFEGAPLAQLSQQTNTWCLLAGLADGHPEREARVLPLLLDRTSPTLARSGPYFWTYQLPLLIHRGRATEALATVRDLWGVMLDNAATCCWETFTGDHLDSLCHPWSAAPVDALPRHLAGIGTLPAGADSLDLRPRLDDMKMVDTLVCTFGGDVHLRWEWLAPNRCAIAGRLPVGIAGLLHLPDGRVHRVTGAWQLAWTSPAQA